MLRLRRARLKNWMTCHETELDFPELGIVRVLGINHCAHGKMESVGAGKSALGDAIHRVAFGVNRRKYGSLKDYSLDEKGNTLVDVVFDLNGKELLVESGYRHKEISSRGEGLRFTYDGVTVERDKITETRKELVKTIGVIPDLAAWTCCLDGDRMDFGSLPQSERVGLIMNAVRAPDWDLMHARAKKTLATLSDELSRAEEQLRAAQTAAEEAQTNVEEAEETLTTAQQAYERTVQNRQAAIEAAQVAVREKVAAYDAAQIKVTKATEAYADFERKNAELVGTLEKERLTLKSEVATLRETLSRALEHRSTAKAARRQAKESLEELQDVPKTCSKCGKAWDTKISAKQLKKAQDALDEALKAERKAEDLYDAKNKAVESAEEKLEEKADEISRAGKGELARLSRELQTVTTASTTASNDAQAAKQRFEAAKTPPSNAQVIAAEATLKDRRRAQAAAGEAIKLKSGNLAEAQVAVKAGQYMVTAFGPTGMPNMFLEDVAPELNARAREVSELLTGGTLLVRFETRKSLADGREQAELLTRLDNRFGSQNAAGTSKGETGLTNLIIAETLARISSIQNRVAYRWFDEVINTQDNTIRKGYLRRLHEEAHRDKALVFIVDHHAGVEAVADHTLVAEKWPDKGTTYRWI